MKQKKMIINKNKLVVFLLMILLLLIQIVFICYESNIHNHDIDKSIIAISWLSIVSFAIELILWKKLTKEFFSPFVMFSIVLYVFTLGQTIGWAFGIDMGTKDWLPRVDHGMNHYLIFKGLVYSIFSVSLFFLGAIIGERISKNKKINTSSCYSEETVIKVFNKIGKILLWICIPTFILTKYFKLSLVLSGGYGALYDENTSRSLIQTISNLFANFYQPCLLLLLISNKDKKNLRMIILILMLVDVFLDLLIGGRSPAVMIVIGILLAYHYFVKPLNKKKTILVAIGGYFGMAILNTISSFRGLVSKSIYSFFEMFSANLSNVLGNFIGELGWNLSSICWTMNLVPSNYPFRYGMSYLTSFISFIPSVIFGGPANHPATIYANLTDWLQNALNMGYGPGYTMIAESYINFGWYGLVAMLIMGYIIARFIAKIKRTDVKENMLDATFQIIFIMIIMKSLVRSSLSVAVRSYVLNILPLLIILKIELNRVKESKKVK